MNRERPQLLRPAFAVSRAALLATNAMMIALASSAHAVDVPFAAPRTIATGLNDVGSIRAADIDGDGDLDLVCARWEDDLIVWYENDGAAPPGFTARIISTSATSPRSVFVADVDGDGDMDVLSAAGKRDSTIDNRIRWYQNNGASPPGWTARTIFTATDVASSVAAADLDNDGDLDVISASYAGYIYWHENNGAATPAWTTHTVTSSAGQVLSLHVVDANRDGHVDVVSSPFGVVDPPPGSPSLDLYLNLGTVPVTWATQQLGEPSAIHRGVSSGDLDADGDIDLVSSSTGGYYIVWIENSGGATPGWTWHDIELPWPPSYAYSVLSKDVTDLDQDGDLDILVATTYNLGWIENGGGSPISWTYRSISSDSSDYYIVVVLAVDLDGDGDPDALQTARGTLSWRENRTIHRAPYFPAQTTISTAADGARSIFAADLNNDGDVDVLSASFSDDKIAIYHNNHASPPSFTVETVTTAADGATSVFAADIDGDGDPDPISASQNDNTIAWYRKAGRPLPVWTRYTISTAASGPQSVFAADMDGDGDIDVLSASFNDDKIAWYESSGASTPTWTARTISTAADGAYSVCAADINGDGHMDAVSASYFDNKIAWYQNNGASPPAWTARNIATSATNAVAVATGDMNRDGRMDVLAAYGSAIVWYRNNGGSPPTWSTFLVGLATGATCVKAADVDRDGDLDVLATSGTNGQILWFENDGGSPPWTRHIVTESAISAQSVLAVDLDLDGDVDLLSASFNDDRIAWYDNRGGQFALATTPTAPASIMAGEQDDLLKMVVSHRGKPGDNPIELQRIELLLQDGDGHPLDTQQANAIFDRFSIYKDTGSGAFEPINDLPVHAVLDIVVGDGGVSTLALPDGLGSLQTVVGTPSTYFLVAVMTPDAHQQSPNTFRITHLTAGSIAEDVTNDSPLRMEDAPAIATGVVVAEGPPRVNSIVRAGPNPTHASTVDFIVTFSENVTHVTTNSFSVVVVSGSIAGASVAEITGGGAVYTVTVDTGEGDGELRLDLDNVAGIVDAAGLGLTAPHTGDETYLIDKTPPHVVSITRAGSSPAFPGVVDFTVAFDDPVVNVTGGNFSPAVVGGSLVGTAIAEVSGSGSSFTVAVNTGAGAGRLRLDLTDPAGINNLAGLPLSGTHVGDEVYTITPCPGPPDADGDGIGDACDDCPNTVPGATVGADGCPDPPIPADFDHDGDVDHDDYTTFAACGSGPAVPLTPGCESEDLDHDGDVDMNDFGVFQRCYSGENDPAVPSCAN